nr:D-alanyl-D-alanine carboxypeptidase [Streptomyces viridosporus]
MAGESPDRSKQRESSAEPTSGSAGPVPEARNSAEERDPRLAVAREAASSKNRGSGDTATRVLSVREATEDAAADDASTGGRDDSAAEGAGRLSEAVASWVRPAEPGAGTGGAAESEDGAEDAPADGGKATAQDGAGAGAGTGSDAGDASERATAPAGGPKADDEDDEDGDKGEEGENGGTDADEGASDASGSEADGPSRGATADAGDAGPGEAVREAPEAGPAPDATGGAEGTADDASHGEDGDEPRGGAPTATGDADDAPEAGPSGDDDASPDADPSTSSPKAAPADRTADGGSASDDADDSDADDDADPSTDSREAGAGAAPEAGGPKADDDPSDTDTDTDTESGSRTKAEGPVDQPTAVFRTRPPSAPPVDQPTTMLKWGDAGAKATSDSASESKPEAAAERTSKFVALKEFDDPGTRKPPRGEDATTALRTAPPAARPPAPAGATAAPAPQVEPERTTQQPLPPKPPLDLLAELTNTPPPPETPLRTAVRRVKIWTPLVLLLVIVFAIVQNVRPLPAPTLELTAQDSYTFEGDKVDIPWPASGQAALDVQGIGTFGSSGEQKPVPIASVAKVMTAYLVLRDHPLKSGAEGPMIKIDELAEKQSDAGDESTVDVTAGDEISQREAIEAVLIASANNVARLLARWDAGSEEAFVEKMNEAAKDLGMTDTTYTDPSGLNNTTVSTAVDQVKLAKAAMQQPVFREVAAMMSYDDYKGKNWPNWNQLVGSNGVVGIKTGTTTSALGNLVFAAKKEVDGETRLIIGAVVRQPAGGKENTILSAALTSSDLLIRAAQGALESATILKKGTVVGYVDDGLGGRTPVAVTEDVEAVGWAGLSVKLTFAADDDLPHQAEAGTKVGTLTVGDGTSSAVKVPVALQEDLVEPGFTDKLTRVS